MTEEDSKPKRWPGQVDQAYPEVYTAIPTQPDQTKPGQLTQAQLKHFFRDGFVVVEDLFKHEFLDSCREGVNMLVDDLAKDLFKAGKISSLYDNFGFFQRLTKLEKDFPGAGILLAKKGIMPKAVQDLWSCDPLLNVMEQLLGTADIVGHPVWNLRTKMPQHSDGIVPWHQDNGYFDNDAYGVLQPVAWIPLLDTDPNNGCMQMVRGGHRAGRVATHKCCYGDTWHVFLDEEEIEHTLGVDMSRDVVTCPVPYGGALLFTNMTPHRSLTNKSDVIRWSLDLRWQRADQPIGFYGVKEGLRMRSATDPDYQIDWAPFLNVNRMDEEKKNMKTKEKEEAFDTTIQGPWMRKWEMTNTNRHTASLAPSTA